MVDEEPPNPSAAALKVLSAAPLADVDPPPPPLLAPFLVFCDDDDAPRPKNFFMGGIANTKSSEVSLLSFLAILKKFPSPLMLSSSLSSSADASLSSYA